MFFKLIKKLGSFVSKMYAVEARKQTKFAQSKAKLSLELDKKSRSLEKQAGSHADTAAKLITQSKQIGLFFIQE